MTLAPSKHDGKWDATILSISFDAVQVRNYLPVSNGYIFDFMVAGKTHEQFRKEQPAASVSRSKESPSLALMACAPQA